MKKITFTYKQLNKRLCYADSAFREELAEIRPDWFFIMIDERKKTLLKMAREGKPKPTPKQTSLYQFLNKFMNPKHKNYDPEFTEELKRIRPDWFRKSNKEALLQMAKDGKPKPTWKNKNLYVPLLSYTNPNNKKYDPEFTTKIKKIRPEWLKKRTPHSVSLLKMAKDGKPRPTPKQTSLYGTFCKFINPNSEYYNPEFTKELKRIRPDWKRITHKEILLKMAKDGKPKPISKTYESLYQSLIKFMNPNSKYYDPEFTNKIKQLRPDWFERRITRKDTLLRMAKDGKPKPKHDTKMGRTLNTYTNLSYEYYDPEFTNKIKQLRPEWLKKSS